MSQHDTTSLYVEELLHESGLPAQAPAVMKHPFACGLIEGMPLIRTLAAALNRPLSATREVTRFAGDNVHARSWTVQFQGQDIPGVTAVFRQGDVAEIRIMLSAFPATAGWREEARRATGDALPATAWELPAGTDQSIPAPDPNEVLDAKLPFQITQDVALFSPVLTKPVHGEADVVRVIGHASAVYGSRSYGPRIMSGASMLSFWTASVSGVPIEVANVIQINSDKLVTSMTMSMQPWPAVQLFRNRVRVRTEHFLDQTYFDLKT